VIDNPAGINILDAANQTVISGDHSSHHTSHIETQGPRAAPLAIRVRAATVE